MAKTVEPLNVPEGRSDKGGFQIDANKGKVRHTKASFETLIAKYKIKNPVKFANKKSELEKKLNNL